MPFTSLVDIYTSRPDLQREFPKGLQGGTQDNANLNNWWNTNGRNEYPNVTLVAPGDSRIQPSQTLTREAQIQPQVKAQTQSQPQSQPQQESQTGDPVYDQLLGQLDTYLQELQKRGQVLNPNIELTPQQIAEFTAKAEGEINPYYASQLKIAREALLRSQGYTTDDILRTEQDYEKQYGKKLRTLGEGAADIGFAQSGLRIRDEGDLAQETQQTIDKNRRDLAFTAGTDALNFAQKYGASDMPQTTIQSAPRVLAGEGTFQRPTGSSAFYNISPSVSDAIRGLVGSEEYNRRAAVRTRASELEGAQRTLEGINQARTLTL